MGATKSQVVQARVDPKLKKEASDILDKAGLSTSAAFTLFLRQVVMHRGLPFEVKIPNKETRAALKEDARAFTRHNSVDDMFDTILGEEWRA
jgi:DNA-damage-inducible protein J